jgi:DNA-binding XRE family transcriptional regulator
MKEALMGVQFITTPDGGRMAILPADEYEAMIDARDAATAMAAVRSGQMETLSESEMDEYLSAPAPLSFWRKRRGLTQADLARKAGISQAYAAQIEAGSRTGGIGTYVKFSKILGVKIEDLLSEEN